MTHLIPILNFKQLLNSSAISEGAHILYTFTELDKYYKNAADYIADGLLKGEKILLVDKKEYFAKIQAQILSMGYSENHLDSIIFVDAQNFYLTSDNNFNAQLCLNNLVYFLKEILDKGQKVRTWGQVDLPDYNSNISQLREYESASDKFVENHQVISVCTYQSLRISSFIQNEMSKVHHYLMTDDEIALSPFYRKENVQIITECERKRFQKIETENKILKELNIELLINNRAIKMKKELIEQSEKLYRTLLNEMPISLIITTGKKIVYINKFGLRALKLDKDMSTIEEQLHPLLQGVITDRIRTNEIDIVLDNGETIIFEIKSIPTLYNGEPALLHAMIDLTQQKFNEQLIIRSEKLNIAGELAAGIAHEIRNPLTAIMGFFQMLRESEDKNSYYKIINDELSRIEQISSELLILARPHSENRSTHNIVQIVLDIKLLLEPQALIKKINILIDTTDPEIFIECEETKIKQIFINLIKNAIEVMDKGKIHIHIKKFNNHVKIDIMDEGPGMSKELLEKIGEPFYTTKEKGTGLGLMICYKIVESHNGAISVQSKEGYGTKFTISLPLYCDS